MRWPFRKSRHPYPRPGFARHAELIDQLRQCDDGEDLALRLHGLHAVTSEEMLRKVFEIRETRIAALTELRWYEEADKERADLAMRRKWVEVDATLTPLAMPDPSTWNQVT